MSDDDVTLTREQLISLVQQQADQIAYLEGEVARWKINLSECRDENQRLRNA